MNLFIVIPAFNAADTLPSLLERTIRIVPKENIIVVNDGSNDATGTIAVTHSVRLLQHERNKGKGAALQSGIDAALRSDCDAVVTMDADLQHQPEDIPRFIEAMTGVHCDVVIGSRLDNKRGMPFLRVISNTITTWLVKMKTGAAIRDSQSGFRLIRRRVLEHVRMDAAGYEAETEFILKASKLGYTFGSVPIGTVYAGEKSHMSHVKTTINFIKVLIKDY